MVFKWIKAIIQALKEFGFFRSILAYAFIMLMIGTWSILFGVGPWAVKDGLEPWWAMHIVLILVGGMGSFIIYIDRNR